MKKLTVLINGACRWGLQGQRYTYVYDGVHWFTMDQLVKMGFEIRIL